MSVYSNNFYNTSSVPWFPAKVWANWQGTGTVTLRADGGVSSITDGGVGFYYVYYSNNFSDGNYSVSGCGEQSSSGGGGQSLATWPGNRATNYVLVHWRQGNQGSSFDSDALYIGAWR